MVLDEFRDLNPNLSPPDWPCAEKLLLGEHLDSERRALNLELPASHTPRAHDQDISEDLFCKRPVFARAPTADVTGRETSWTLRSMDPHASRWARAL